MSIIVIGIDLAKNIFAVHGVNENGRAELVKPKVSRDQLLPLIANLPPCTIGMEACSGAHYWARLFRQHGHTVKLVAPKFVTPYRMGGKRGKNDAADAAAICETITRPHMRFVPIKEEHQQIILCLHRTRQGFVAERTATYNRLRGLISEFGIVLPQKVTGLRQSIGKRLDELPGYAKQCINDLLAHADQLDLRIADYDKIIAKAARPDGAPRHWPGHRQRALGQHRQRPRLQEWPAGRGLDRADTRPTQQRRQGQIGAHHQSRGQLPEQFTGYGRARRS